jgi:cold-inducible RNA-binding protein
MNNELYVGNLPMSLTEENLVELVSQHGPVAEVRLRLDRAAREPTRFAFVTMTSADGVAAAIFGLNGREVGGRELRVKQSTPPGEGGDDSRRPETRSSPRRDAGHGRW